MPTIDNIINLVSDYVQEKDLDLLREAYLFADKIHAGKKRDSGEPYIAHPLAVAHSLASMRLDAHSIAAGLLHSTLKEGPATSEAELKQKFGADVARLVAGTTKIINVQYGSHEAYQAENIRKLLLAMAADVRVILVRLADRLNDMQTLEFSSRMRQLEVARETMDLYAPLASRLGIDWIKRELEDLSFRFIHPEEFTELNGKIESSMTERLAYVEDVKKVLRHHLEENGLQDFVILGRPKHLYSIYKKLIAQQIPFEKVYDKVAFRIIVKAVKECYEVLGIVHSIWQPIAHRFKDFISSPKANGYQSLHTSVIGPHGEFMEIQIRTEEMDEVAKEGVAAHWAYKEGKAISQRDAKFFQWVKQLIQGIQEVQDPKEFLDTVKGELRQEEIYVLTPNGEVKGLSFGSTPLDFAYCIHTEVGNHCAGAKVNGRIVPLKYELQNGDVVEILTSPHQLPNRGWLQLVKTGRARGRIRHWLRQEEQEKNLQLGRELCERELRKHNVSLKKVIRTGHLKDVLKKLSCNSLDDLLIKVGRGKISVAQIAEVARPPEMREELEFPAEQGAGVQKPAARKTRTKPGSAIVIDGIDDVLVSLSKCCMPVPGDEVMGFITAGRGISVHKTTCRNLLATDPQRWIEVSWSRDTAVPHHAQVRVIGHDQRRLLMRLSDVIGAKDGTIMSMEARTDKATLLTHVNLVVEVSGVDHLETLIQQIRKIEGVLEAGRR
ncbi:MAG: bifunctional (p)ppGpp synthetase/guanosine-3',5'-bis(diphosphate) 3'-pyrophosphohydrolase [Deltaproteobacteria bacterium]